MIESAWLLKCSVRVLLGWMDMDGWNDRDMDMDGYGWIWMDGMIWMDGYGRMGMDEDGWIGMK